MHMIARSLLASLADSKKEKPTLSNLEMSKIISTCCDSLYLPGQIQMAGSGTGGFSQAFYVLGQFLHFPHKPVLYQGVRKRVL